jgi:hypothetical protein
MSFTFKHIKTTPQGVIHSSTEIDKSIIRDFFIEQSVGDELVLKSGEITLSMRQHIFPDDSFFNWIAVYLDDILLDVYSLPADGKPNKRDDKFNTEVLELSSIQLKFLNECKYTRIQYTSDTDMWNYVVANCKTMVNQLVLKKPGEENYTTNAPCCVFPLFALLGALTGTNNKIGFEIGKVSHDQDILFHDVIMLWRGGSKGQNATPDELITWTFYGSAANDRYWYITWLDLFKWASVATNCFIAVRPRIEDSVLKSDIKLIPKINISPSGGLTGIRWFEREWIKNKFQIQGVQIEGKNFKYDLGSVNGNKVFRRSFDIADYNRENEDYFWDFCLSQAEFNNSNNRYDNVNPYFASGLPNNYYNNMITAGHGYEGNVKVQHLDGSTEKVLKLLDVIQVNSNYCLVNNLFIDERGYANIEAIIL